MGDTLLLVAHGSRDPRFAATARRVLHSTRRALPGTRVELAYLDLNEPLVDDALAALDGHGAGSAASRPNQQVTVVPLLFGDGYHSKIDLPAILARARARNPGLRTTQTPVLGTHSPVPALLDRLAQATRRRPSGVVLYAVGSSDPESDASAVARGRELSHALGVPVRTVFATRLGPDGHALRTAVAELHAAGATHLAAVPLFLSAGLLTERVERLLDQIAPGSTVTGPLADHPALITAITALNHATSRPTTPTALTRLTKALIQN